MADPVRLSVNGLERVVAAHPDTPLLYALRNDLGLKGTRFGCGSGQCGACFVLIDGHAAPSCDTPLWSAAGKKITPVQAFGVDGNLHPLQPALPAEQAPQCAHSTTR